VIDEGIRNWIKYRETGTRTGIDGANENRYIQVQVVNSRINIETMAIRFPSEPWNKLK
jgi:hypothetical protein